MRAKRLTWKGETTHLEGRIDPGRIGNKGEMTRGKGVKRAKRPDADQFTAAADGLRVDRNLWKFDRMCLKGLTFLMWNFIMIYLLV